VTAVSEINMPDQLIRKINVRLPKAGDHPTWNDAWSSAGPVTLING
jgi:hypothetical protein